MIIVGLIVGLAIGLVIGRLVEVVWVDSPKPEGPHEHKWVPVASDDKYQRSVPVGSGKIPQTLILKRCRCGETSTEFIDGKWTPDQLGINDETVAELLQILNEVAPHDQTTDPRT